MSGPMHVVPEIGCGYSQDAWVQAVKDWEAADEVLVMPYVFLPDSGHSCGFRAIPVEFTSQNFTPATEFCNSGIYTRTVPGIDRKGMALESSDRNEH